MLLLENQRSSARIRLNEVLDESFTLIDIDISNEEIKETSGEIIHSDNVSDNTHSVVNKIPKLSKLKSDGVISEDEFVRMKNDLIDNM